MVTQYKHIKLYRNRMSCGTPPKKQLKKNTRSVLCRGFLFILQGQCLFLFVRPSWFSNIYIYVSRIAWVRGQNHPYFSNNYSVYIPGKDKHILLAILRCWWSFWDGEFTWPLQSLDRCPLTFKDKKLTAWITWLPWIKGKHLPWRIIPGLVSG